jgi:hypothetical protein
MQNMTGCVEQAVLFHFMSASILVCSSYVSTIDNCQSCVEESGNSSEEGWKTLRNDQPVV